MCVRIKSNKINGVLYYTYYVSENNTLLNIERKKIILYFVINILLTILIFKGDSCCWHCQKCDAYARLVDEFTCEDCGNGSWPHENKTECYELERKV